jgi:outer membrane biosynthesis protein TonB
MREEHIDQLVGEFEKRLAAPTTQMNRKQFQAWADAAIREPLREALAEVAAVCEALGASASGEVRQRIDRAVVLAHRAGLGVGICTHHNVSGGGDVMVYYAAPEEPRPAPQRPPAPEKPRPEKPRPEKPRPEKPGPERRPLRKPSAPAKRPTRPAPKPPAKASPKRTKPAPKRRGR